MRHFGRPLTPRHCCLRHSDFQQCRHTNTVAVMHRRRRLLGGHLTHHNNEMPTPGAGALNNISATNSADCRFDEHTTSVAGRLRRRLIDVEAPMSHNIMPRPCLHVSARRPTPLRATPPKAPRHQRHFGFRCFSLSSKITPTSRAHDASCFSRLPL